MQLVELVLQGVRRFADSQKLAFKPGLNVVYGPNESGKTTLLECIRTLLLPDAFSAGNHLIGWANPQISRAALTIKGETGESVRVIRDYVSGAVSLAQLNPQTGKFESVASDPMSAETRLQDLGVAPKKLFETLYFIQGGNLSLDGGGVAAAPSDPGISNSFFQGPAAPEPDIPSMSSPEEIEGRIRQLEEALRMQGDLEKVQFELDGLEGKKFEMQSKLSSLTELENRVSQAKGEANQFGGVSDIDDDLGRRLERFSKMQKSHDQEMATLDQKREALSNEVALAQSTQEPVFKNYFVIGGSAAFLLSFVLAKLIAGPFVFLILPAMGAAGFGAYQWYMQSVNLGKLQEGLADMEKKREETQRRFEVETAVVQELLKKLDVRNVDEILERLRAAQKVKAKVEKLEQELAQRRKDPEIKKAQEELAGIDGKIEALQDKLSQYGAAAAMDAGAMQREIAQLRAQLGGEAPPPAAAPVPTGNIPGAISSPGAGFGGANSGGGVTKLFEAAGDVSGNDAEGFWRDNAPALNARLAALTGNRYSGISFEGGALSLLVPSGQAVPGLGLLSQSAQEAVYLALALGTAESLASTPLFLFDDVGARFDDQRLGALANAVKALLKTRNAQALWVTSRKELAQAADHLIKLKA